MFVHVAALPLHHRTIVPPHGNHHGSWTTLDDGRQAYHRRKSAASAKAKEKTPLPTKGKWMPSTIIDTQLDLMVDFGYLPQPTITIPRSPIIMVEKGDILAEVLPKPVP